MIDKSDVNGIVFLKKDGSFTFLKISLMCDIRGPFAFLKRNVLDAIQKNKGDNKYNMDGFFTIFSFASKDKFVNAFLYN